MPAESEPLDTSAGQRPHAGRRASWYSKLLSLCFVIFCFDIGVFLVVFPWLRYWESNNLASYSEWLADVWGNPYFRGALSGIGLANIYISFLEILRLIRGQIGDATANRLE